MSSNLKGVKKRVEQVVLGREKEGHEEEHVRANRE